MFTTISLHRLSAGSVYKLLFIGLVTSMVPLGTVLGAFAFVGFNTVSWNGAPLHGTSGLLGGPFVALFVALLFTAFLGSATALGLWVYSKFRPLSLRGKSIGPTAPQADA